MRLPDVVNQIRRKLSEASTFARNPMQVLYQRGRKSVLKRYEQASLPGVGRSGSDRPAENGRRQAFSVAGSSQNSAIAAPPRPPAPIATAPNPQTLVLANSEDLQLSPGDVLQRGWGGRYAVGARLQDNGWMRLYEGQQENGAEAVWIYEYRLSKRVFSAQQIRARQAAFKQLIDLNSRLGEGSDFRILTIRDAIVAAESSCYLICKALSHGQGLADYIAHQPRPFSAAQVREFLRQVLQSLQYLQAYQLYWPDGSSQRGLPHGCIRPESLWIRFSEAKSPPQAATFFVYLSRLALWEHLFYPGSPTRREIAHATQALGSISEDLSALGLMAGRLLIGNDQANPANLQVWPADPQVRALYPFVCRLMGEGAETPFQTADAAIQALRSWPEAIALPESLPSQLESPTESLTESPASSGARLSGAWLWLLVGAALLSVGLPLRRQLLRGNPVSNPLAPRCLESQRCMLKLGKLEPSAQIKYGFERGSDWHRSFFRTLSGLQPPSNGSAPLEQSLETRMGTGETALIKAVPDLRERNDLLRQVQLGQLQAGFIRGDRNLNRLQQPAAEVEATQVAADGIAVFVVHSNSHGEDQGDRTIPKLLNGRISLLELRQLFTQQQSTIGDEHFPVKLYLPTGYGVSVEGAATLDLFSELVFDSPEDQTRFRAVQRQILADIAALPQQPDSIYAHMLSDFERQRPSEGPVIGIGVDRISRMYGQCSVYPLALTQESQTYSVLVDASGHPIDPEFDLCGDKGAYWVNSEIFDFEQGDLTYPLGYPMAVAYPKASADNSQAERQSPGYRLAQGLRSIEGQYLLSETGLIPIIPMSEIRRYVWRGGDVIK